MGDRKRRSSSTSSAIMFEELTRDDRTNRHLRGRQLQPPLGNSPSIIDRFEEAVIAYRKQSSAGAAAETARVDLQDTFAQALGYAPGKLET